MNSENAGYGNDSWRAWLRWPEEMEKIKNNCKEALRNPFSSASFYIT